MAEYGTKEFYEEELERALKEKDVLYGAMESFARHDTLTYERLDFIVDKAHYNNMAIHCFTKEIEKLENKTENEENDC